MIARNCRFASVGAIIIVSYLCWSTGRHKCMARHCRKRTHRVLNTLENKWKLGCLRRLCTSQRTQDSAEVLILIVLSFRAELQHCNTVTRSSGHIEVTTCGRSPRTCILSRSIVDFDHVLLGSASVDIHSQLSSCGSPVLTLWSTRASKIHNPAK